MGLILGCWECLCSPLQGWSTVLRRPDKAVTVVTTYPPLPGGTERIEIRFVDLGTLSMPVTPASNGRRRAGEQRPWTPTTWQPADLRSGSGWTTENWPTRPVRRPTARGNAEPSALVR